MTGLGAAVMHALQGIYDPCSVAANAPLSLPDMGLIRSCVVAEDSGEVQIELMATSPFCVLIGSMMQAIENEVTAVPGVTSVGVTLDAESLWTPDLMGPAARARLDERRRESLERVPVRPRQWMDQPQ